MNLKRYFSEVREIEASLGSDHVFIMSLETEDGGRAGVVAEVPKYEAAVMIKQGRGRVLTNDESEAHRKLERERRTKAHEQKIADRLQVTVVSAESLLSKSQRELKDE